MLRITRTALALEPRRGRARIAPAVAALLALIAAPALAAVGDITFTGCIANAGANGCTDPALDSLAGASGVAVSPDGASVYAVSYLGNAITTLTRAAGGALTPAGCIANGGANGCIDPAADSLAAAFSVVTSPDGLSVYVASFTGNAVTHFARGAGGALTPSGCVANAGANGCTAGMPSLAGAAGVAVSADGASVYAAASLDDAVTRFVRDPGGAIVQSGCLSNAGGVACVDLAMDSLDEATGIAVSPDGASVYVASAAGSSITHFARAAGSGTLAAAGCIANGGAGGCTDPPLDSLAGAGGVAVSPDGTSVYVASSLGTAVTHFVRAADGSLVQAGCIANGGANGCTVASQPSLEGASRVAVSPDGRSVYVNGFSARSITHFLRAPDGSLVHAGCIANDGIGGCFAASRASLNGATGVAVSPDGTSVYVASFNGNAITHLTRELASATTTTTPTSTTTTTTAPPGCGPGPSFPTALCRLDDLVAAVRAGVPPGALAARLDALAGAARTRTAEAQALSGAGRTGPARKALVKALRKLAALTKRLDTPGARRALAALVRDALRGSVAEIRAELRLLRGA